MCSLYSDCMQLILWQCSDTVPTKLATWTLVIQVIHPCITKIVCKHFTMFIACLYILGFPQSVPVLLFTPLDNTCSEGAIYVFTKCMVILHSFLSHINLTNCLLNMLNKHIPMDQIDWLKCVSHGVCIFCVTMTFLRIEQASYHIIQLEWFDLCPMQPSFSYSILYNNGNFLVLMIQNTVSDSINDWVQWMVLQKKK